MNEKEFFEKLQKKWEIDFKVGALIFFLPSKTSEHPYVISQFLTGIKTYRNDIFLMKITSIKKSIICCKKCFIDVNNLVAFSDSSELKYDLISNPYGPYSVKNVDSDEQTFFIYPAQEFLDECLLYMEERKINLVKFFSPNFTILQSSLTDLFHDDLKIKTIDNAFLNLLSKTTEENLDSLKDIIIFHKLFDKFAVWIRQIEPEYYSPKLKENLILIKNKWKI